MAFTEGSSEANRIGKVFSANYIAGGVGPNLSFGPGLSLGYHINSNQIVLLELRSSALKGRLLTSSSLSNVLEEDWSENYTGSSQDIGVHLKQFTSNSFYFRLGIDYHTANIRIYESDFVKYRDLDGEARIKGNAINGSFAIGNQWQWANFTLGVDWIGFALPLTSKVSTNNNGRFNYESDNERYYQQVKETYLAGNSVILLRTYLGASF